MDRVFRIDFYPTEWLTLTAHMTPDQRGVFIQICALIYAKRGRVLNDPEHIGRISNCSGRKARSIIDQLCPADLQIHGEFIGQKRCERVLNSKRTHFERSVSGGRTRVENDSENNKNKDLQNTKGKSTSPTTSRTRLDRDKKEESVKETLSGASDKKTPPNRAVKKPIPYSAAFNEFWSTYPLNEGTKAAAFEKYQQALMKGFTHETIISGARAYDAYCAGEGRERRYIKHASTWLNQRGWESDYTAPERIPPRKSNGAGHQPGKGELARHYADKALAEVEDSSFFGRQNEE